MAFRFSLYIYCSCLRLVPRCKLKIRYTMGSFLEEFGANELWQAYAHIWNHTLSYGRSMCLKCAADLGIADIIHSHGKPITLSQLETELRIPPARSACFRRLMRLLVHLEYFSQISESENEKTLFGLTAMSALIMKEKVEGISPLLLLMMDQALLSPWQSVGRWLKGDEASTPFEVAHGKDIFEVTKQNPEFNSLLQAGMASDTRLVVQVLIREYGDVFQGLRSLVDVGGGTGTMAMAIAEAYPQLKCTVFDLPHVVAPLVGNSKVEVVGGDMFDSIPPADAVLLKWVLHDWSDVACVRILQRCKEAIPSKEDGGKVVIVEMVLNVDDSLPELAETQLLFDLFMMANTSGKQRSEAEWSELFKSAGFSDYTLKPLLDFRSVIEVYY
ncbi:hypothetical protein BHE74_00033332 [Ensete ventricosum]|nr:hypothetical protein BHE74_00033332 [Ensete ventricosum]